MRIGRRAEPAVEAVEKATPRVRRIAQNATHAEKGVFGEAVSDEWMTNQGFAKMNGELVRIGDRPRGRGIDGVWRNPTPPPEFIITESKFGTSPLKMTRDGQQMSEQWIRSRLNDAVGKETADEIRAAGYERWLLQVDKNGDVTRTILR